MVNPAGKHRQVEKDKKRKLDYHPKDVCIVVPIHPPLFPSSPINCLSLPDSFLVLRFFFALFIAVALQGVFEQQVERKRMFAAFETTPSTTTVYFV